MEREIASSSLLIIANSPETDAALQIILLNKDNKVQVSDGAEATQTTTRDE
jgi:hypothetical protein